MNTPKNLAVAVAIGLAATAVSAPVAATGIPVVDAASILESTLQHAESIAKYAEQITQLKNQLDQMKQQYESISGSRGMENLLSGENYNTIPTSWQETLAQMQGSGEISGLAKSIKENARMIDEETLQSLPRELFDMSEQLANTAASEQAAAGQVYDNAAGRYDRLKSLTNAIGSAQDQKAILELIARINAEEVMLQNELVQMQALAQVASAQRQIENRQAAERGLVQETGQQQWTSVVRR
jgi:type IV secretion system protein VirB5